MPSTVLDATTLTNPVGAQPGHVAVAGSRLWTVRNTGGAAPAGTFLSYSDDQGVTWTAGAQIGTASTVYSHVAALQTTGGAWVLVAVSANVGGSTAAALTARSMTTGVDTGTPGALSTSINIDAGGTGLGVANASVWTTGGTNPRVWVGARKNGTNAATPATSATNYWARLWHCPIANVGTASSWVGVNVPGTWGNGAVKPVVGTDWTVGGARRCTVVALDAQASTTAVRTTDQYMAFTFDPQPTTIALGTSTVMATMTTGRTHSSMAAQTGGHSQTIEARADYLLFARQDGATTEADWDLYKTVNGTTWTAPTAGQGIVAGRLSMDTDDTGDFYLAWRTTAGAPSNTAAPMVYAKWTAATDTLGATAPLSDTNAGQLKIYVGSSRLVVLYRDGTASPYNLRADNVTISAPANFDGTASFTGSGSATGTGKPSPSGTAQGTGSGSLSAVRTVQVTGAAGFTGSGSATGTATASVAANGSGSGSGQATGTAAPAVNSAASLTGAGSGTGTGKPTTTAAAAMSGSGSLATSAVPSATGTGAGSGSGQATSAAQPHANSTATGAGTGSLTGSTSLAATAAGSGTGTGAASGTGTPNAGGSANLTGTGSLTATPQTDGATTANLTGAGSLATSATPHTDVSAFLVGSGQASATGSPAVPNVNAGMSGSGTLTAVGGTGYASAAQLAGSGQLTGTTTATARVSVGLTGSGSLAAVTSSAASGEASANLSGTGALTVAVAVTGSGAVSLTGAGALAAAVTLHLFGAVDLSGSGSATGDGSAFSPSAPAGNRTLLVEREQRTGSVAVDTRRSAVRQDGRGSAVPADPRTHRAGSDPRTFTIPEA